jgi:ribosomal protein S27AE
MQSDHSTVTPAQIRRLAADLDLDGLKLAAFALYAEIRQREGTTTTSITCPRCGMTSFHPKDVEQGYCGRCDDWTTPDPVRAQASTK